MPNRHYPPAYLRYLRARLWNLGKPSFWGTAIFLSVVGLGIREYWFNPDTFTSKQKNTVTTSESSDSSISEEDKAIAADIDNLPALFGDAEQVTLPLTGSKTKGNSQADKNKNYLQDAINKQQSSSNNKPNSGLGTLNDKSQVQEKNLFVSQAENLLRFGATDNSQLLGLQSPNYSSEPTEVPGNSSGLKTGLNVSNNSPNSGLSPNSGSLNNPLQTSIDQTTSGLSSTISGQVNSIGQSSYGGVVQNLPTNIPTNTGLNTGTGYIQPTVPNPQPNSYNFNNGQAVPPSTGLNTGTGYIQPTVPSPQPNSYNNFNNSQVQSVPNPVPQTPSVITGTSPIIGPYTIRRNSNPTATVTPIAPIAPALPSSSSNLVWQQPTQLPQSNLPASGQNTGGVQNNGYSYP